MMENFFKVGTGGLSTSSFFTLTLPLGSQLFIGRLDKAYYFNSFPDRYTSHLHDYSPSKSLF